MTTSLATTGTAPASATLASAVPAITTRAVTVADASAITALHARVFGPGRFARTAYRVREGTPFASPYCRAAMLGERMIASLRMTRVVIGGPGPVAGGQPKGQTESPVAGGQPKGQTESPVAGGQPKVEQMGALILGPLAVDPDFANLGYGRRLIAESFDLARASGERIVVLVGDMAYYGRLGFAPVLPLGRIRLPGPADPARILALSLQPGAADSYAGLVTGLA